MVGPGTRYRAFISYSQQDREWGRRIHTWLETYRIPDGVRLPDPSDRRLGRFFRDDEDMAAASDIAEIVRRAIEEAESLIVICSPRSAQSKWVNAEIQHYRRTGRARKVFAVIIDGVPNSGDPDSECFPPALRAAGDPEDPDALPIEPLGLDVRKDGRARACARLAAGLIGVDFDDLWQRDRRRAEARMRTLAVSLGGIATVFAALTATSVWFGAQASRNAAEAEAARRQLQGEYLGMLGETALEEVLDTDSVPGEIVTRDPAAWISLMRLGDTQFAIAREQGAGRFLAIAHDGVLTGLASNRSSGFLRRAVEWLAGPRNSGAIRIASGHCEWLPTLTPGWILPGELARWGYRVADLPGAIDDASLRDVSVLIVGNAWGDFQPSEVAAVERFVNRGGGLLAAGLGWSWRESSALPDFACPGQARAQDVRDIATYPMNRLAEPFGLAWTEAAIR